MFGRGRRAGPVDVPAGPAILGARLDELPFGWDNEFPRLEVDVPAFRIDGTPVTKREFLAFVEDGGYARPICGPPRTGVARRTRRASAVLGAARRRWLYRTLFDALPLERVATGRCT